MKKTKTRKLWGGGYVSYDQAPQTTQPTQDWTSLANVGTAAISSLNKPTSNQPTNWAGDVGSVFSSIAPAAGAANPLLGLLAAGIGAGFNYMGQPVSTQSSYNNGGPILPPQDSIAPKIALRPTSVTYDMVSGQSTPTIYSPELQYYSHRTALAKEHPEVIRLWNGLPAEGSNKKMSKVPRYREYADGGDIPLSDNAFQVQGNPSQVDSESYQTSSGPIRLDHDEVVKEAFVFSNRIKNPLTNQPFAADAAKLENSTGKAEKKVKLNPQDRFSQNTIKYNDMQSDTLKALQEMVATAKGKRNPDGSTKQAYQTGGPIFPQKDMPYMALTEQGYFYDPYNDGFLYRDPKSGGYQSVPSNLYTRPDKAAIDAHIQQWPPTWERNLAGQEGSTRLPEVTVMGSKKKTSKKPASTPAVNNDDFFKRYPGAKPYGAFPSPNKSNPSVIAPFSPLPTSNPYLDVPNAGVVSEKSFEDRYATLPEFNSLTNPPSSANQPINQKSPYGPAMGDLLQLIDLGSKFGQLIGGPEKERQYADTTPVTKQSFDVRPALYQNQRNFQNQVSGLDTPSITLRRALQNQMYAQKLNADSQVLSQYQQMNNQAATQFEDRLSNRQRSNIGLAMQANDLNARNRGQYANTVQNAFTSLGNYGEAVNQQQTAFDALKVLKAVYPDVYDRIMSKQNS